MIRVVDTKTKVAQDCKRPGDVCAAIKNVLDSRGEK